MSERTALEIAGDLEQSVHLYTHASLEKAEAAEMLRSQAAEIARLKRERHHIYDLLARIHRDGGQYTAEHGVEKACDDAEAQVVTWLDTLSSVDALIEQARIAEREACAHQLDARASVIDGLSDACSFAAECLRAEAQRMMSKGKS